MSAKAVDDLTPETWAFTFVKRAPLRGLKRHTLTHDHFAGGSSSGRASGCRDSERRGSDRKGSDRKGLDQRGSGHRGKVFGTDARESTDFGQRFNSLQAAILMWVDQCIEVRGIVPSVNDILIRSPFVNVQGIQDAVFGLLEDHWLNLPQDGTLFQDINLLQGSTVCSDSSVDYNWAVPMLTLQIIETWSDVARIKAELCGDLCGDMSLQSDALQGARRFLKIPENLFYLKPTFLVRVKNDAMRDVGISEGDFVAIHQRTTARSGQLVLTSLEGTLQVRRFSEMRADENAQDQCVSDPDNRVMLFPENTNYQPIVVKREALAIAGVMVGVIKASPVLMPE